MKNNKIYLSLFAAGALFTACNDLDQLPNSNIVTEDQKEDAVALNPDLAAAAVNALPDQVNSYMTEYETHIDVGWASMMLMTDTRGQDMPSALNNYQWYTAALEMSDFGGRYYDNLYYWNYCYAQVRSANMVVSAVPASEDPELMYYRAQGLTFRAYAYYNLAQMYCFTYMKDPNGLTVPLILDTNMNETAANGCARATAAELYAQIKSDLTEAIGLFKAAEAQGVDRTSMVNATIAKTFASTEVALGLRARAHMMTNDWAAMAADADEAIKLAAEKGMVPYERTEVAVPTFHDLSQAGIMWGMYADPGESEYRGVANWASHMTGWQTNGYAAAGVYRCVNKKLYEAIPSSDVRKGWWLNASAKPSSSLPGAYSNYVTSGYAAAGNEAFPPYATVKFGSVGDAPTASGAIATPMMRVEELYLMLAEGQGMQNASTGMATLKNFVTSYRDPGYSKTASSPEALQELVWEQRRIELWGEGFAYYDLMRLQKGIDRRGGGFPAEVVFNIAPDNTVLLFDIPQSEIQRNPLIVNGTNGSSIPQPVADEN